MFRRLRQCKIIIESIDPIMASNLIINNPIPVEREIIVKRECET